MGCSNKSLDTEYASAEVIALEDILEQHNELVASSSFDYFFNINPLPALILNQHRQAIHANKTLLNFLGVDSPLDVLGKRPGEAFSCIHIQNSDNGCGTTRFCTTCGAVKSILKAQKGKRESDICRITTFNNDDFDALELEVWAEPMPFRDETFTVFHIQDISDSKRRRALERVFFHDVLNSIQSIVGNIDLYKNSDHNKEDYFDSLEIGINSLIEEVVSQKALLDAENGDLREDKRIVNIGHLLQETVNQCKCLNDAAGKEIIVKNYISAEELMIDSVLLKRVLINMIKNALEATENEDKVTVSAKRNNKKICFTVHNEQYIPYKVQLQIFKRSFSTKGSNRGLGTFSMKLFTEKYLCGKVTFESEVDTGTTFKLEIPAHVP